MPDPGRSAPCAPAGRVDHKRVTRVRSRTTAIGAAALLALLLATGCGAATAVTTQDGSAPRPSFPPETSPVSLWLSASEVPPGAEVVAILRNPTGAEAVFGVAATVDRWDGAVVLAGLAFGVLVPMREIGRTWSRQDVAECQGSAFVEQEIGRAHV